MTHTHYFKPAQLPAILILSNLLLVNPAAQALQVQSGQFIQTIDTQALFDSSTFTVNDFFDHQATIGLLRVNIIEDSVLGPPPLSSNQFTYAVHGPDFVSGHPERTPGINSFPSNMEFEADNFIATAGQGRIGLGGVMRFDLPPLDDGTARFFLLGDWSIEYDASRAEPFNFAKDPNKPVNPQDNGVSGWFLRNHFDFPAVAFDVLHTDIFTTADSFYMSGQLAWSPEMTEGFFPETELYRAVSSFVMCAQDDTALAANSAQQIPCVFPNIRINDQSKHVQIPVDSTMQVTVDLGLATDTEYPQADYFAAFTYEGTFYWLNQNFTWSTQAGPAYQGALFDFRNIAIPAPTLPTGNLPSGTTITLYFAVDGKQNGVFDQPYRYTSITLDIQ